LGEERESAQAAGSVEVAECAIYIKNSNKFLRSFLRQEQFVDLAPMQTLKVDAEYMRKVDL
jgi:hypothetical protein